MDLPKFIDFNGERYRLAGKYYRRHKWGTPGHANLHRAIWEFHNGPIPEGCHIHHKDGNTLNNSPGNLECLTMHDHRSQHALGGNSWHGSDANRQHLAVAGEKAKQWHKSEEGRAWHAEHAGDVWRSRKTYDLTCVQCGAGFTAFWSDAICCSKKCLQARRYHSGVDDVERVCVTCGATFSTNKYFKVQNCGKACADVARSRTKRRKHGD